MKQSKLPKTTALYTQGKAAIALGLSVKMMKKLFDQQNITPTIGKMYSRADLAKAADLIGTTLKEQS